MNAEESDVTRISDLGIDEFGERLNAGLGVQFGPFAAKIRTSYQPLIEPLYALYRDYPVLQPDAVFSFHVRLDATRRFPNVFKPLVRFSVDGRAAHEDMPAAHALPVLEWGINLVIALRFHCYLMLHAAVLDFDGGAMLLPAAPGSGKSTLCAGLALSGWRLLSDEFGLLRPGTTDLVPVPRPIALKNESIQVIRNYSPDAVLGPNISGTRKGTVAHVKAPTESIRHAGSASPARWIVFPKWRPGIPSTLTEIPKSEAFMFLATNAFNYELLGESAFQSVTALIGNARCFHFEYSNLDNAVAAITDFVSNDDG